MKDDKGSKGKVKPVAERPQHLCTNVRTVGNKGTGIEMTDLCTSLARLGNAREMVTGDPWQS